MKRSFGMAVAAIAVALGAAFAAAPAFAGNPPNGANLGVTVTVNPANITLAMVTGSLAITGQPGTTTGTPAGAVTYSVTTTDTLGYSVAISAPDLVSGTNKLLADSLTDMWAVSPGQAGQALSGTTVLPEANAPATIYSSTQSSGGGTGKADAFTETWQLVTPGTTVPGVYTTTISYVATAK